MNALKTISLLLLLSWQTISAQTTVSIQINASLGKQAISPYIYGKNNNLSDNSSSPTTYSQFKRMREAGLRFTREFGGNNGTKYNWRLKMTCHPDWYNNVYLHDWDYAARKLQDSLPGVQGMWAFQLIGSVAKSKLFNFNDWNFNKGTSWSGTCQNLAGKGLVDSSGGCKAKQNGDTSLYLTSWTADSTVGILDHWFGAQGLGYDENRIQYWSMDNEPEIWSGTHDDAMPTQLSAEAFMQKYFEVAKKARAKFPNIKLCGPIPGAEWQWYSWSDNKISYNGKMYGWLEYFILRCAEEQKATSIKLLDVLDIHNYPTVTKDSDIVQIHRMYYDQNYIYPAANGVKKSGASNWDNSIKKEYIFVRCSQWLTTYMGANHGVSFGVSESGAANNSASVTAVSYASMLGTFADNQLDFFTPWSWYPGMWETMHLFSRYAKTIRVQSESSNEHYVTAYSSVNAANDSMTVILVNRSLTETKNTTVSLSNITVPDGGYQTLRLSQLPSSETFVSHTNNSLKSDYVNVAAQSFPITLPPLSITAVVLSQHPKEINSLKEIETEISICPNPNNGLFTISSSSKKINKIEVFDVLGQKKEQIDYTTDQTISINLSELSNGLYFLHITTIDGIIVKSIVIQK